VSEAEWERPSTNQKICRQNAAASMLIIQPEIETGRKTKPKGLNHRMDQLLE
jgi:hypothetical protein